METGDRQKTSDRLVKGVYLVQSGLSDGVVFDPEHVFIFGEDGKDVCEGGK